MRTKAPVRTNAVRLLKQDHSEVKKLFDEFEDAKNEKTQHEIAQKAISELKVHAAIEEEIFYPAARAKIGEEQLMDEAAEEHHVVKVLIEELENMHTTDGKFAAKFMVLAENVRHHIKEEESEMLPKVSKSDIDLDSLGSEMMERKEALMSQVE